MRPPPPRAPRLRRRLAALALAATAPAAATGTTPAGAAEPQPGDTSGRVARVDTSAFPEVGVVVVPPVGVVSLDTGPAAAPVPPLAEVALTTGGRALGAPDTDALVDAYARVRHELTHRFLVTYRSAATAPTEVRVDLGPDRLWATPPSNRRPAPRPPWPPTAPAPTADHRRGCWSWSGWRASP